MTNEKPKRCESCGQKIRKLNPHNMDRQKVRVLEDIAKLNIQGHNWVLVKEGDSLETAGGRKVKTAYRARAHASRLCWFALMDHHGPRTGGYRVNERGFRFLRGDLSVPEKIWCRDGIVIERSERQVTVNEVEGVVLDRAHWDAYGKRQKPAEPGPPPESKQLELI